MTHSRRQFLGALGAGAVASVGLTRRATAQETPVVEMGNDYFDPIGLHVDPGTTVRFEIAAGSHSATAYPDRIPADASAFDSGTISEGSFEYTFDEPGTYDYYCIPHKSIGMVGRVVVGDPGGPAEESRIPDGDVPDGDAIVEQGSIAYGTFTDGDDGTSGGSTGPGMGAGGMGSGMGSGQMGPGMGPGPTGGWAGGWLGGLPFVGGALALVAGGLYWALGRSSDGSTRDADAIAALEDRYARGEIDEEEFRRRRARLEADE
ncbi:plastocyanin/azurin family copper-binding protein [Halolamina rubra]|uniref:plastocyanin/azurin family copper-binding protein n=1 Tax=Halolamina rubra TaxID=1380430 RepID=UPI000678B283|nr:plastocyanin/azurin family copper-binding protein [Halolamina rubra]